MVCIYEYWPLKFTTTRLHFSLREPAHNFVTGETGVHFVTGRFCITIVPDTVRVPLKWPASLNHLKQRQEVSR